MNIISIFINYLCYFQFESSHEEGEDLSRGYKEGEDLSRGYKEGEDLSRGYKEEDLSRGYKEARLRNIQDIRTKLNQLFPGKTSLSSPPSADGDRGVSPRGRGQGRGVSSRGRGQGRKDESGSGSSRGKNNVLDPIKWNNVRAGNFVFNKYNPEHLILISTVGIPSGYNYTGDIKQRLN